MTGNLTAAATVVGLADRDDLRDAFGSLVVVRPAEREIFEDAFEQFFGSGLFSQSFESRGEDFAILSKNESFRWDVPVLARAEESGTGEIEVVDAVVGGSYAERLANRDFGDLTDEESNEVRELLAQMAWRPAEAMSRRWRPARRGVRPDLRRTFRMLTGPERDLMPLAYSDRRPRRRPVVVLADISGSMERYTELFMHFVHAAQGRLGRVEAFAFATRLTRVTREMRRRSAADALSGVSEAVVDWSGGTRIGESLKTFNWQWSRRVGRGGAIGLIISDGWDTGDPELLDNEMARFHRSMHRVIWLNPLAGRVGYSPDTRGMRIVLPYVDDLLAAASVRDLRAVVRLLESIPAHRRSIA